MDFNPDSIESLKQQEIPYIFGDAADPEFLQELHIASLKYVVSTIPDWEINKMVIDKIREKNKKAIVVVISQNREEALALYEAGATYVIMPHYLGAQYASRMIARNGLNKQEYKILREKHCAYLDKRNV